MAVENGQPQEIDLDKTDRLPILEGDFYDPDVADDAVRMERVGSAPGASLAANSAPAEFVRPSPIDLPSLAESVRSVEERIARQTAEYDALTRSYERTRDAEAAAGARANATERDLAMVRTTLESEQIRLREMERTLTEKDGSVEGARTRAEEASRESERYQAEARTLRDSLAARDATIVQVLHSLGERDAQLSALQAEHARVLPALEARANGSVQLEQELLLVRGRLKTASAELKSSREQANALSAQLKRGETKINAARSELTESKAQASSYFELLRTRDWRSGFEQNLFRDLDARAGVADAGREALTAERDRIQGQVAGLEAAIAAHRVTIDKLQIAAAARASAAAHQAKELEQAEQRRVEWIGRLASAETEKARLAAELAARDQVLAEAQAASSGGAQRIAQIQSEYAAKIAELEADTEARDQEMTVLMAHLKEARRPIESIDGEVKHLREELALKVAAIAELTEEADKLRAALERTRGALEEREFLIRRLERSESNNANVLGRIQTSMERLGSAPTTGIGAAAVPEWAPELIRIDGDRSISHTLGRRTRIGRAPGCEVHVDSTSVSRHHALILAGTREAIIEDLNSTNGVILNGRKITRQVLNDGDIVTIGEIQFRYVAKPLGVPPKG
ncbi:MAG TPA: FHA domain-containing protein [Steroidobacteraceae bacterium]|nr:FHA domain-containing protein [Steroidobacteraceae bacterium]